AGKELAAKNAELQGADNRVVKGTEQIEADGDARLVEDIKSTTWSTPEGDYDWDVDAKACGNYSDEAGAKLEEQYAGTFNQINEGEIIEGIVVSINNKDVVLNVGFKSDGLVAASEFRDLPDLKAGDKVDVFVESQEDANGQLVLSRKRAK